jgi:hypothetical protein
MNDLDGHLPTQDGVAAHIDLAHAALGQESNDFKFAKMRQHECFRE